MLLGVETIWNEQVKKARENSGSFPRQLGLCFDARAGIGAVQTEKEAEA
jgi:hypothetical protein